ncbi:hypothetical protein UC8_44700 [Roseimaritima ulvae]|uniref:Uncharacterized protein n=1 Tax=Roseimaritima ulvae TaxID=980254 RepID=A0A5B9R713_9BACT|nr:hypothetical protein UC8_44700 [Roseimaritima ulvae]
MGPRPVCVVRCVRESVGDKHRWWWFDGSPPLADAFGLNDCSDFSSQTNDGFEI